MTNKKKKENWQDKLFDLIEKEIYLATGSKSKEHFSGDCKMNDILGYVGGLLEAQKKEIVGEIEEDLDLIYRRIGHQMKIHRGWVLKNSEEEIIKFVRATGNQMSRKLKTLKKYK